MYEKRKLIEMVSPGKNSKYVVSQRDILGTTDNILKANSFVFFAPYSICPTGIVVDRNIILNYLNYYHVILTRIYERQFRVNAFVNYRDANAINRGVARATDIDTQIINSAANMYPGQAAAWRAMIIVHPDAMNLDFIQITSDTLESTIASNSKLIESILDTMRADIVVPPRADLPIRENPPNIPIEAVPTERLMIYYPFTRDSIYTAGITSYEATLGEEIEVAITGEYSLKSDLIKFSESDKRYLLKLLTQVPYPGHQYFTINTYIPKGSPVYWDYGLILRGRDWIPSANLSGIYFSPQKAPEAGNPISRFYIGKITEDLEYTIGFNRTALDAAEILFAFYEPRFSIMLNAWYKK